MASSGLTRPGDYVVKSIECYNRLFLDRNCNISVPKAYIENELRVDIGANVFMPATTIDFTNSTIDFTGASITGLTANVTGTFAFAGNIVANGVVSPKIYGGTYYGAVEATTITTNTLNVTGTFVGDVCGSVITDMLMEKNVGEGIMVDGVLMGTEIVVDKLTGNTCGTHVGDVETTSISGNVITLTGVLEGNLEGTFTGSGTGTFTGELCGNVVSSRLKPKPGDSALVIEGDVILSDGNLMLGNACFETLLIGNAIVSKDLSFVSITPGINTPALSGISVLTLTTLSATNVNCGMVNGTTGCFTDTKTNSIVDNGTGNISVGSPVTFTDIVCADELQLMTISGKAPAISVTSNVEMGNNYIIAEFVDVQQAYYVAGTRVVSEQQSAIGNAAVASSDSLTDSTGATPDQIVSSVSASVGNVSEYMETGGGGVTVTSASATDLDTTQTALAVLTMQVNDSFGNVDARLDTINDNFSDVTDEVNKLITDVEDIRTQLNTVLVALRAHGLIAAL